MKNLTAFASGLLFSVGLILSGMTRPANIIGFLDFFGDWNPALLFVMVGAMGSYILLYPFIRRRNTPLFEGEFEIPSKKKIDRRLLVGAAAFGVGWGLSGFCPGPAMSALASGAKEVWIFFGSMLAGIWLYQSATSSATSKDEKESCG